MYNLSWEGYRPGIMKRVFAMYLTQELDFDFGTRRVPETLGLIII